MPLPALNPNEPLLTPKELLKLNNLRKKGDTEARDEIFRRNLGLAYHMAASSHAWQIPKDEAVSMGLRALAEGIEEFDFDRAGGRLSVIVGLKFRCMANDYRASFTRGLRVPHGANSAFLNIGRAYWRLAEKFGEDQIDNEMLAEETGASVKKIRQWRTVCGSSYSLDLTSEEVSRFGSIEGEATSAVSDNHENMPARLEMEQIINSGLVQLSPIEQEVIRDRFGLNEAGAEMTLKQIGRRKRLTRERIRQIEFAALRKLARYLRKMKSEALLLLAA